MDTQIIDGMVTMDTEIIDEMDQRSPFEDA